MQVPLPYLSAQGGDVPLEGGVHPVEGLGFAEVLAHVLRKLLQLLLDLSHQLLPIIKVPGGGREGKQTGSRLSDTSELIGFFLSRFNVLINSSPLPLSGIRASAPPQQHR